MKPRLCTFFGSESRKILTYNCLCSHAIGLNTPLHGCINNCRSKGCENRSKKCTKSRKRIFIFDMFRNPACRPNFEPRWVYLLFYFLSSCTPSSPWQLDAIAAGEKNFNSARLQYKEPGNSSPLRFEMIRVADHIEAYLHLVRYSFTPSDNGSLVKVLFTLGEEQKEEWIPLLEGGMKLRIPPETTQQIITILQKGEKVSILSDDFEQILSAELFSKLYAKLTGPTIFFQNPIKGPLQ